MASVFYGEFTTDEKRRIKQDVAVCAVTGERIRAGDELRPIPDTPYFVRLRAGIGTMLTDEAWQELIAKVKAAATEVSDTKKAKAAPKEGA